MQKEGWWPRRGGGLRRRKANYQLARQEPGHVHVKRVVALRRQLHKQAFLLPPAIEAGVEEVGWGESTRSARNQKWRGGGAMGARAVQAAGLTFWPLPCIASQPRPGRRPEAGRFRRAVAILWPGPG